jgi:signal transduction histidine kinase
MFPTKTGRASRAPHLPPLMNRIARLLGLVTVLLLLFLTAVAFTSRWSRSQFERLRTEAIQTRQSQWQHLLAFAPPGPPPWPSSRIAEMEAVLDARILVIPADAETSGPPQNPAEANPSARGQEYWRFNYALTGPTGEVTHIAHISFLPPAAVRLAGVVRQATAALMILALALLVLYCAALFLSRPKRFEPDPRDSDGASRDLGSLTHLAKTSVEQTNALHRERTERLRAEEDLHFQQVLLNRALEEKIRLGHDLHDGIIQSLYATGLTLEAAKNNLEINPGETRRQLDMTLATLNTTIRDVRSYIIGLAPENLRKQSFAQAVDSLTKTLGGGRTTAFDVRIDETVTTRLRDEEMTDLLQITHEAVSNSLRHGAAAQITIRLHQDAGELCLLVQDNGKGFDPAESARSGHGLGNMRARAERLKAKIAVHSAPGAGTRLVLTLPSPIAAS